MQMIKEIYTLYVERWHFFLDLTWEHLQISLTSIVIATIVGLGLGIMISMYRKGSSTVLGLTTSFTPSHHCLVRFLDSFFRNR